MERDNNQQLTNINEEEVLVTNAAIKTTDILMTIGAGAFALTGIGLLVNTVRKNKRLKEKQDFEARILARLVEQGSSEEEIANVMELLRKTI